MKTDLRTLRGLIIHRSTVREKDRIIEAYTREEGRVVFFAPGVRHVASKRAGHLETFMESKLTLARSKKGNVLSEAHVINSFPELRSDYDRLSVAYEITKLVRQYTAEGQHDFLLYDTVISCINTCSKGNPPAYIKDIVATHVLRQIGGLPDLFFCTHCRAKLRPGKFSLKASDRGFWCENCEEKSDPALTEVVKLMRIFVKDSQKSRKLIICDSTLKRLRMTIAKILHTQGGTVR